MVLLFMLGSYSVFFALVHLLCFACICLQINMPRPEPVREPSPPPGPKDEDFIDETMAVRSGPGRTRSRGGAFLAPGRGRGRKGALEFVEEGSLQRQAEIMRLKQKYGELHKLLQVEETRGLQKCSFAGCMVHIQANSNCRAVLYCLVSKLSSAGSSHHTCGNTLMVWSPVQGAALCCAVLVCAVLCCRRGRVPQAPATTPAAAPKGPSRPCRAGGGPGGVCTPAATIFWT